MSICSESGLTRPECSCPLCLEQQLRQFQPGLLAPSGPEIRITRTSPVEPQRPGEDRPRN